MTPAHFNAPLKSATAFAPATVANIATGFDILGFAIHNLGDRISMTRLERPEVKIESISGLASSTAITLDPAQNTAGVPLLKMIQELGLNFGFSMRIEKGIPLGSGLGGSAASAVGAVVAAHALLPQELKNKLTKERLIHFALEGEAIASGSKHADNIAPCLYGGLTLSHPGDDPDVTVLPYPKTLAVIVVHPEMRLDTKKARGVLKPDLFLKTHIQQSSHLAALVAGCCTSQFHLIKKGLVDLIIEPQRAHLIPGFYEVKRAALESGVLGCSISGAGPSVFAFAESMQIAEHAKNAMIQAFKAHGKMEAQGWVSEVNSDGARVVEAE